MIGELAALSCSFLWSLCSLAFAYAGRRVGASAVNQLRIHMALVVLVALHATLLGAGVWPAALSPRQLTYLLVSGIVGLTLGDLCLFLCMAAIGPRLGTLLMATSPLLTVAIGRAFLGERLGGYQLLAVAVVLAGVAAVLVDRRGEESWRPGAARLSFWPVVLGLCGALGQSVGLVLQRAVLEAPLPGETAVEPLSVTVVRMSAGALGMVVLALATGRVRSTIRAARDGRAMRATAFGALCGPVLGVWMSAVAVRHADVGVAATLMSFAPVLMIPIARIAYGARPGPLGVAGTLLAVAGGALLFAAPPAA
ncbi:MAG: DMT family transporter [Planctomycetes bacterium]|nr:DMT family transporter [Planctomycetota bacterium]